MPTGLQVKAVDCSQIDVSWNASSGSEGYYVYRNGNYYTKVMAPFRSLSDAVEESTAYSYQVAAYNAAGPSPRTSAKSATTPACQVGGGFPLRVVGSVTGLGDVRDVAVNDLRRLAVVASSDKGLTVIGLGDPEEPVILGTLDLEYWELGVAIVGDHAYVAELQPVPGSVATTNMVVVDLSNPASPRMEARLPLPGSTNAVMGIALDGPLAYVAATTSGLQVVDVSDPTAPRIVGCAPQINGSSYSAQSASSVALGDGVAFVASHFGTLQILHIADPSQPMEVLSLNTGIDKMALGRDALVFTTGNGFLVFDVSNPSAPFIAAKGHVDESTDVAIAGDRLAVGTQSGVSVFDLAQQIDLVPRLLGEIATPAGVRALVFAGSSLLAGDAGGTLSVLSSD